MGALAQTDANIPGTDLTPSLICLGTAQLGTGIPETDSFRLLDAFLDLGGSFVDTAHIYADWQSTERAVSEKTIGRWLRREKKRTSIVLATKGGHHEPGTTRARLRPAEILHDLQQSLSFLQSECIDLYWMHRDDRSRPVGELLDFLEEQVRTGRIRYYGCSNWSIDRIEEARKYADRRGIRGFVANQPMWSLARPNPDGIGDETMLAMGETEVTFHRQNQLTAVPYSSQPKGFFTKMHESRLPGSEAALMKMYANDENRLRSERAITVARDRSRTVNEVVLAYLLSQPFPVFPIVGCRTVSHLENSMKAASLRLDQTDLDYLERGGQPP